MCEPAGQYQASTSVESPVPQQRSSAKTGRLGNLPDRLRGIVRQLAQAWRALIAVNSSISIAE